MAAHRAQSCRAAELLHCNQSSVSRSAKKCQEIFGVSLVKKSSEWIVQGDEVLLSAERKVHQAYRWEEGLPLRLDAQHWHRDFYGSLKLEGWLLGNLNYLEYERPAYLIENRIIDAWLCSAPDTPRGSAFRSIQLTSMPVYLCVKGGHPLEALGSQVTIEDVRRYPLLPLPERAFPVFSEQLRKLGLGSSANPLASQINGSTEAIEDLLVGIANPMTLKLYGPDAVVLPIKLPIAVGDVLTVHADFWGHPRMRELLDSLTPRLQRLSEQVEDIEVLGVAVS